MGQLGPLGCHVGHNRRRLPDLLPLRVSPPQSLQVNLDLTLIPERYLDAYPHADVVAWAMLPTLELDGQVDHRANITRNHTTTQDRTNRRNSNGKLLLRSTMPRLAALRIRVTLAVSRAVSSCSNRRTPTGQVIMCTHRLGVRHRRNIIREQRAFCF
jgi:hypothetical protein